MRTKIFKASSRKWKYLVLLRIRKRLKPCWAVSKMFNPSSACVLNWKKIKRMVSKTSLKVALFPAFSDAAEGD